MKFKTILNIFKRRKRIVAIGYSFHTENKHLQELGNRLLKLDPKLELFFYQDHNNKGINITSL